MFDCVNAALDHIEVDPKLIDEYKKKFQGDHMNITKLLLCICIVCTPFCSFSFHSPSSPSAVETVQKILSDFWSGKQTKQKKMETDETRYFRDHCKKNFSRKANLKCHKKLRHVKQVETARTNWYGKTSIKFPKFPIFQTE